MPFFTSMIKIQLLVKMKFIILDSDRGLGSPFIDGIHYFLVFFLKIIYITTNSSNSCTNDDSCSNARKREDEPLLET